MTRVNRGIVCETKKRYTAFLTSEGEFLRGIPTGNPPNIGEEADFYPVSHIPFYSKMRKPRFVGAVAIAAMVLIFMFSSILPANDQVMAYVQVEGETAIELGINRSGNVVSFRYLNDPPSEFDNHSVQWNDDPIQKVLEGVVGTLSTLASDKVFTTTIFPDSNDSQELKGVVGNAIRNVQGKHDELNWDLVESTEKERSIANKQNLSIHKYKKGKEKVPNKKELFQQITPDNSQKLDNKPKVKVPASNSNTRPVPNVPSNKRSNEKETPKNSFKQKNSKQNNNQSKNQPDQMKKQPETKKPAPTEQNKTNQNSNKNNPNVESKNHKHPNQQKQNKPGNQ